MKATLTNVSLTLAGELQLTLTAPRAHQAEMTKFVGREVSVEIKKWHERRSLSANAYAWVLIGKIAESMRPPLNKGEVYIEMLKRYGQGGIVTVQKEKADEVLRAFDYYIHKGEGEVNGKSFHHLMVYVGSSKYNTAEMALFIEGIVSEAKELGIETMTPQELACLR